MEAVTEARVDGARTEQPCSSFAKSLFLGEIHEDLVFPWPQPDPAEQDRVRALIAAAHELGSRLDPRKIEEDGWIGDDVIRELGERGLCGLYVPERYGGQGLSQTGYARVFETFARIDATLSIVLGVHQSIGFKGIHMFGTEEQKERFLPDLAAGRKLAGFALTEPNAGSDAYHIESRAVQQADGSWLLNGEKRYIGNGGKGSVFTTFARCEVDGKDRHIALIVEKRDEGLRGRRALRHHGAARATTCGASTSRTCGCRRRTCSASRARASTSRWRSSTTGGSGWGRARSAPPSGCSTRRSTTSTIAASSAIRWPTSSWSRTRSAGWSPTCSGWSRCAT